MQFNTHMQELPPIRITLREDQSAGVSLGHGVDLMPGETAVVEHGLAVQLLAHGRAVRAEEPEQEKEPKNEQEKEPKNEQEKEQEEPDPAPPVSTASVATPEDAQPPRKRR